jgi:hypothetical protein
MAPRGHLSIQKQATQIIHTTIISIPEGELGGIENKDRSTLGHSAWF